MGRTRSKRIFLLLVEGRFVCTGPEPNVPDGWLDDVLSRSKFDFKNQDKVWATDGLDFDAVAENNMSKDGYLVLNFIDGSKVNWI